MATNFFDLEHVTISDSFDNLERYLRDILACEKHGALRLLSATSFAHCVRADIATNQRLPDLRNWAIKHVEGQQ